MLYLVSFYLLVFSIIAHKEPRFLTPIVPFILLMLGYCISTHLRTFPRFIRFFIYASIVVETVTYCIMTNFHFRQWEIMVDLQNLDVAPHSVYSMQKIDMPYYTWTHRKHYLDVEGKEFNRTKVYMFKKDPTYARKKYGIPL